MRARLILWMYRKGYKRGYEAGFVAGERRREADWIYGSRRDHK